MVLKTNQNFITGKLQIFLIGEGAVPQSGLNWEAFASLGASTGMSRRSDVVMRLTVVAAALLLTLDVVQALRYLKEGPLIDAEGREYKSPLLRAEEEAPRGLASAVHVHCSDTSMTVAVEASLFQTGRPVSLFLGEALDPSCRAAASTDGRYVIRAELLECGSKLSASKDFVIYSNKLVFSPAYVSSGPGRSPPAVVPVSCRYKRRNVVSSNPQQSLVLSSPAQERTLTLQLMSDDWLRERASKVFTLGEILHLQALYMGPDPGQRRVFIDNCVATLSPDPGSVPRYYFITNHGCLVDTKQGGLASRFQPRQKDHSLQLELDVFLFDGHSRNLIFITCQLKVTSKKSESSFVNKACSYEKSRWKNVDGNDDVCQCCDGTCSRNTRADQRHLSEILTCASASVGPLTVYPRK